MTREEMLTLIIQKFGFEAAETINFAKAMESGNQKELETLFETTIAKNVIDNDENDNF